MKVSEYTDLLSGYFAERGIEVSPPALRIFQSPKYLNKRQLNTMPEDALKQNLRKLLGEVFGEYERRLAFRPQPASLQETDVEPVLERRLCKLPPICGRSGG